MCAVLLLADWVVCRGVHFAVIIEGECDEAYASGRARASTRDTLLHCASDV